MMLRNGLLTTSLLVLPIAAGAQPVTGLYIGVGVGVNLLQDQSTSTQVGGRTVGTGKVQSEVGFAGVLSLGWGFGNGLRAELEGSFRDNKFNKATTATSVDMAGGWEQKYGPMVNVLYDFNGLVPWLVPYVGAGVGYQWAFKQNVRAYNPGVNQLTLNNNTQGAFAYQAIAGAAFPLPAIMPGLAATLEYRFMGLTGTRSDSGIGINRGVAMTGSVSSNSNYNHSILVGLRYNFGVAPPPPPAPAPIPAAAPARSYLVFFDWDKATLTDRARQIIREAADNSTKVQYTRIEVNGYTDTSGTAKYNQGLSIRRAQAVAAELVKDGVPRQAISIQGFGDTHLLVPTGPGVREPQNRRVEIIIR
jgi:outer membrane protein OmpA-like peptidoglycan-associated protein